MMGKIRNQVRLWSGMLLFAFALLLGVGGLNVKAAYTTNVDHVKVGDSATNPTFYYIIAEPVAGRQPESISGTITELSSGETKYNTAGDVSVSGVWKNADGTDISGKFEEGKKYLFKAEVKNYKSIKTDLHGEIGNCAIEICTGENFTGVINTDANTSYPSDGADILYTVTYTIPKTLTEISVKINNYNSKTQYKQIPKISATIQGEDGAAAFTVSDCYFYESTDTTKTEVTDGTSVATGKTYNIRLRLKWSNNALYKYGKLMVNLTDSGENNIASSSGWKTESGEDYLDITPKSFIGVQTINTINLLYDESKLPGLGTYKNDSIGSGIVTSSDSEKYVISYEKWYYFNTDNEDWYLAEDVRFLGKVMYGLRLEITPVTGYSFAEMEDMQVQINGQTETTVEAEKDGDKYVILLPLFETKETPFGIYCQPDPSDIITNVGDFVKVGENNVPGLSWDAEHRILTIDGYNGSWIIFGDPDNVKNDEMVDVVVRVKNSNTITTPSLTPCALNTQNSKVLFVGDGTIDINVGKAMMVTTASAFVAGNLTIDGPTINIKNSYTDTGVFSVGGFRGERNWGGLFCMKSGTLNVEVVQGTDENSKKTYPSCIFAELNQAELLGGQINITLREKTDSSVAYTKGIFSDHILAVNWENTKISITAPNGVTIPMGQGEKALSILKDGVRYEIDTVANTASVIGYNDGVTKATAVIPAQITLGEPVSKTFNVVDNHDMFEIDLNHQDAAVLPGFTVGQGSDFVAVIMENAAKGWLIKERTVKDPVYTIYEYDLDLDGSWDVSATGDSANDCWKIETLPTSSIDGNFCLHLGKLKSTTNYASVMFYIKHAHKWSSEWTYDEKGHWHVCNNKGCDITDHTKMDGYGAHTFGAWVVKSKATATTAGEKVRKCSVCGYEENESIPATGNGNGNGNGSGTTVTPGGSKQQGQNGQTTDTKTEVTKPAKAKLSSAKNSAKKTVSVKWKKIKDAAGYEVQYCLKKNFKKGAVIKTTKKLNLKVKKLKKGKTYYVRVRAYKLDQDGKTRVYGKWSKSKKVKITR